MVHVAVLQPGAGYYRNSDMYEYLEQIGHTITLVGDTSKGAKYHAWASYPYSWKDNID